MEIPEKLLANGYPVELSIIIVSWNVRDLLAACLSTIESERRDLSLEVIVVDAGSNDATAEMLRDDFPGVLLIDRDDNVGFPKGNNIGIKSAKGHFILLLNPDTEVVGGALEKMVGFLDSNPDVGAVGAKLLNPDGSIQSSRRRFPTLLTAIFESTWLQPLAPRWLMKRYYAGDLPNDTVVDVDWLTGACLMVRKEVIDQIGLMDEDYFMYSEELDWCRRIKYAGWRIVYVPTAEILHHVGKSSEQAVVQRHINYQQAKLRYFRKYHGPHATNFLRLVLITNYCWQLAIELFKGIVGHKRTLRWQRVQAYWQVLRSGLRPAGY